ncbi:MAG: hypothetical protein ACI9RG_000094 [Sulfurimonas sp.]|jgi:hypothetical protein
MSNHVEIKSIDGNEYHLQIEKNISNFLDYSKQFKETLNKDTDEDKQMYKEHKQLIQKLSLELDSQFEIELTEAGTIK